MDNNKAAFDYVAAEKAIAMRKYRCHQNFKSVLTVCAAVSPLIFALSRSLPSASKLSSVISSQVHAVFDNQLYVFTLVMALLAAIYALARQHDEESARSPDIYEEFAVNRVYCQSVVVNDEDKGGVCSETEKKPSFPETEKKPSFPETESKADEESKNAVVPFSPVNGRETVTETESADVALVEKEKRNMRTQSEGFGKKKISSTTRVMRRSETEIYRKNKSCGKEEVARRSGSVEVLDNEEFNRKIQKFIEDMKQTQKEEKRQEEEDERRRRRTDGNYVRMASLTSAVIH